MKKNYHFIAITVLSLLSMTNCQSGVPEINEANYYEAIKRIKTYENNQPKLFLTADGRYSENFWGDKFDVNVEITNDAKITTYKDVEIRVTYYSKTNSVMTTNDYILYEVIPPQAVTKVRMKIDNYRDVKSIGWRVIEASPND
ncbi:MAG: hypothetical protein Roseis2KO_51090 [Roseivirga sp.]